MVSLGFIRFFLSFYWCFVGLPSYVTEFYWLSHATRFTTGVSLTGRRRRRRRPSVTNGSAIKKETEPIQTHSKNQRSISAAKKKQQQPTSDKPTQNDRHKIRAKLGKTR